MKHAVSRDLHAYWDRLRAGRTAPERGEIDPAAIRHILAYTFILDVTGAVLARARQVRFRLSGTRLNALFVQDLRGFGFDRIWAEGDRAMADAVLNGVLDEPMPMVASARGGPGGCEAIDLELVVLPLRHHGRTNARVLGSLAPSAAPSWMGLSAAAPLRLLSFRPLVGLAAGLEAAHDTMAEDDPRHRTPHRRSPQFRVHQGGGRAAPRDGARP